jgi:hypothetical protein
MSTKLARKQLSGVLGGGAPAGDAAAPPAAAKKRKRRAGRKGGGRQLAAPLNPERVRAANLEYFLATAAPSGATAALLARALDARNGGSGGGKP